MHATLSRIYKENGLGFIDNSNICTDHLYRNGLHLNESGKGILANNFIHNFKEFCFMKRKSFE